MTRQFFGVISISIYTVIVNSRFDESLMFFETKDLLQSFMVFTFLLRPTNDKWVEIRICTFQVNEGCPLLLSFLQIYDFEIESPR